MGAKRKTVTLAELRAVPSSETCPEWGATKNNWWQRESCAAPSPPAAGRMSEPAFRLAVAAARKRGDPERLVAEARRAREAEENYRLSALAEVKVHGEQAAEIAALKRRIAELEGR
jgi:hypothetical protein